MGLTADMLMRAKRTLQKDPAAGSGDPLYFVSVSDFDGLKALCDQTGVKFELNADGSFRVGKTLFKPKSNSF